MKLTSHNVVDGTCLIRFVIWSRQGTGMVNVFSPGSTPTMMSTEQARQHWEKCVKQFGFKKAESDTFVC